MPLAGLIFPVFLPKFPFSEPSVYSFSICWMIERQRMRQESITELYRGGKNSHYTPLLIKTTDLLGFPITSLNFYLKETLSTPFFQLFFFFPGRVGGRGCGPMYFSWLLGDRRCPSFCRGWRCGAGGFTHLFPPGSLPWLPGHTGSLSAAARSQKFKLWLGFVAIKPFKKPGAPFPPFFPQ